MKEDNNIMIGMAKRLAASGEITEEEARREYKEVKEAQIEEYMNECLYDEQF